MVSVRCKMIVKEVLTKLRLHYILVELGEVEIMENLSTEQHNEVKAALFESGLELMDDKRSVLTLPFPDPSDPGDCSKVSL